ncbi:hypothetical protein P5673_003901 [Acropora cervicornis]|uniref:Uncharacterized protein n=1 Tax=Acropora cervicornis TaxID=6130 RepID=A0AAD9VEB0_ACRCE|nr:hypothetical protein P5673_003901 [Acropora cervicornis]
MNNLSLARIANQSNICTPRSAAVSCLVEDPEIRKGKLAARALGQVRLVRRFHRTDARNSILLYRNTAQVLPLRLQR